MTKNLTEAGLQQRQLAARKHGVYAFRARGEEALTEQGRSRLLELRDTVQTRPGVVELLKDQTVNMVLLSELVTEYVSEQARDGRPLEEIKLLNRLPHFMTGALQSIKALLAELPDEPGDSAELIRIQTILDGEHDT